MSKLITNKNEIEQAIKSILEYDSLLSIDEVDFGDHEKIIGYQKFKLMDESSAFNYVISKKIANLTGKLIVNTACNSPLTLAFLELILSNIREFYDFDIEIIYGCSNESLDNDIVVEIFLISI
jgi:cell division GTPase FtsZ